MIGTLSAASYRVFYPRGTVRVFARDQYGRWWPWYAYAHRIVHPLRMLAELAP